MATSTLGSGTLVLAGTTSGTTTVTATAVAGTTTLTLPAATDTLVGKATTDTLTNKTLTTPSVSSPTISDGTANGVAYLNGSKVLTTGGSLTWDGTNLTVNTGTVSAAYGKLTVAGGISITPDSSSKFQIGRFSAGAPYSYIKMGSTSSGFKFTDPTDSFDLMALNSTGALSLYGASVSANGVGITFPATQSASSDANTLDDYEEGTWTPTISGGSVSGTQTYSTRYGGYTKIGRQVTLNFYILLTAKGTIAGNILLSNLPFTTGGADAARYGRSLFGFSALATNWSHLGSVNDTGNTFVEIYGIKTAGAALVSLADADLNNNSAIYGTLVYNAA